MSQFLSDYWWFISVTAAFLLFLALRAGKRDESNKTAPSARSFASIRVFRPDELRPYFGIYSPKAADVSGLLLLALFITAVVAILGYASDVTTPFLVLTVVAGIIVALVAIIVDVRSRCVIGPERIAYESPLRFFSWSVPLSRVSECDLVPGRPFNRLRVHSEVGSFSLPLTAELSAALWPAV